MWLAPGHRKLECAASESNSTRPKSGLGYSRFRFNRLTIQFVSHPTDRFELTIELENQAQRLGFLLIDQEDAIARLVARGERFLPSTSPSVRRLRSCRGCVRRSPRVRTGQTRAARSTSGGPIEVVVLNCCAIP
jgi:hypothetical protein